MSRTKALEASGGYEPGRSSSTPLSPALGYDPPGETFFRSCSAGKPVTLARRVHQSIEDVKKEEDQFFALMEERTLSVLSGDRRDMHLTPARTVSSDSIPVRADTVLGYGSSKRDLLAREAKRETRKVPISEGQTGSVFLLEVVDQKVAVFKPEVGETFQRRGFRPGSGAVREEAVYIVDRLCGSEAGVPVTTLAEVVVEGQTMRGAVQAFHNDAAGFCDDFGMPRSFDEAVKVITQEHAERLALLDIRVFNTDRHGGNLLLLGQQPPYRLGPIDHGCCLPPWWALGEAGFSAWEKWVHFKGTPSAAARASAKKALDQLPRLCHMLSERGLDFDAIVTLRLCTTFAGIGVGEQGMHISELVELMIREDFSELSWFEKRVFDCARSLGAKITEQLNERGDKELLVEDSDMLDESWANRFVTEVGNLLRSQLPRACSDSDDDFTLPRADAAFGHAS